VLAWQAAASRWIADPPGRNRFPMLFGTGSLIVAREDWRGYLHSAVPRLVVIGQGTALVDRREPATSGGLLDRPSARARFGDLGNHGHNGAIARRGHRTPSALGQYARRICVVDHPKLAQAIAPLVRLGLGPVASKAAAGPQQSLRSCCRPLQFSGN
jgi:hypothetical protein